MIIKNYIISLFLLNIFLNPGGFPNMIINNNGEDWVDLSLNIDNFEKKRNGTMIITVNSTYKDKNIGFQLEILPVWNVKKMDNSEQQFYWGKGHFKNTGDNTDYFISELAKLYKVNSKKIIAKNIPVELVGLLNDPRKIESEPIKMKFFFNSNSENESLYSEVFINTDLSKNILEFHEKDQSYRQAIINSLTGNP